MYITADTMEDLNIVDELNEYTGVSHVAENYQIAEEEYKDAYYYIYLVNTAGIEDIKSLLGEFGMTAYIEYENEKQEIVVRKIE